MRDRVERIDRDLLMDLESAVNFYAVQLMLAGFALGYELAQNPEKAIFLQDR